MDLLGSISTTMAPSGVGDFQVCYFEETFSLYGVLIFKHGHKVSTEIFPRWAILYNKKCQYRTH
jgi:hypothetical protein